MLNVETHGKIQIYTLDRPKALNAVNKELAETLVQAMEKADADPKIKIHLLRSNGAHFSAGADIKEMQNKQSWEIGPALRLDLWKRLRVLRKPWIAEVQGFALGGGCELALSADIIYCADNAVFGQPEINLGLMPGAGGTVRWTKLVGRIRAAEILLVGERISAQKALEWGVVSKVIPVEQLRAETTALSERLAEYPIHALMQIKAAIQRNFEMPELQAMDAEREAFHGLFGNPDQNEGVSAFVEKRKAQFRDHE